jgi:glycosyltransferase involved in cell wall biosynthesis
VIRVAFAPALDGSWLGGINYFRNLLGALAALDDPGFEFVLFGAPSDNHDWIPSWRGLRVVRDVRMQRGSALATFRRVANRLLRRDVLLERLLVSNGIDLLSHSGHLGRGSRVATLGWMADLQHRRFADMFSARELRVRDRVTRDHLRYCDGLLLSSASARDDLERFLPGASDKVSILHFVADVPAAKQLPAPDAMAAKYALPERYIHLPNQFWVHKNHAVVIEALKVLKSEGHPVTVVCSGSTADYRQPDHFSALMRSASDVEPMFRVLGVIPYLDMVALMRDAVAVINPSLFEGWSTTVEEARSLGKRILLSDIPVHREQAPERGSYFQPHAPAELARLMVEAVETFEGRKESEAGTRAAAALPERRRRFALEYLDAVRRTLARRQPNKGPGQDGG